MAVGHALIDLSPLRTSPAFRRLWIGRGLSAIGGLMTAVAVLYQVWLSTGSTVWTGAVGLAEALPILSFGLFAGMLVDHADRRLVFLAATLGQAVVSALLTGQALFGHAPVVGLLALVAVQSALGAASGPAALTFVPRILPPGQIRAGLALNRIAFQGAVLLGPAVGGLVLASSGLSGCYLVDTVSFGFALWAVAALPSMPPEAGPSGPGWRALLAGVSFVARAPMLRGALLTDLAATVLSMPTSLFPAINELRFGNDPRTLGLFLTAIAVGGVLASLLSGLVTLARRPGMVMLGAATVWGLTLAGFGWCTVGWLDLALLVVAGAADTVSVLSRSAIVQLGTPDRLRGRVATVEQAVGQAGPNLGNMRAGLLGAATSAPVSVASGGLLCVAAVLVICFTTASLRRALPDGILRPAAS